MKYVIKASVDLFMNIEAPNEIEARNICLVNLEDIKKVAEFDVNVMTIIKEKGEK